jgi:hypothetical protein
MAAGVPSAIGAKRAVNPRRDVADDREAKPAARISKALAALREAEMKIQQQVGAITWLEETNPEQNFADSACLWAISGKILRGRQKLYHRDHHFIRVSFNPSTSMITATHKH